MKIKYVVILCLFWGAVFSLFSQENSVNELRRKRKAALEAINEAQNQLAETQKKSKSSLSDLQLISAQIRARRDAISLLDKEVTQIERQQKKINSEISELEKDLDKKRQNYAKAMRGIYSHRSGYDKIIFILSASSLNQTYRRMRYLREYSAWRKLQAQEIVSRQQDLESKRNELQKNKEEKEALITERRGEAVKLQAQEDDQKVIVAQLKKEEKTIQAELQKRKKQADALNSQIEALIAEDTKESVKKADVKAESKGGYAMTKVEKELSDDFAKNKGRLPFPLSGSYLIVGHFGPQQHPQLKYVKIDNKGIDIQTKPGTDARAVFTGTVTKVVVIPGYTTHSVIIRHGNYLTVYSNLSSVYVKTGDKVSTRQAIGKIESDASDGDRTVLNFQIWKETTKLNPELWLDK